jgi:hypothetical protein
LFVDENHRRKANGTSKQPSSRPSGQVVHDILCSVISFSTLATSEVTMHQKAYMHGLHQIIHESEK